MLSKVFKAEEAKKLDIHEYVLPGPEEINTLVEQRNMDAKRQNLLDEFKNDPLSAARQEANIILLNAQEKLKAAQLEAGTMKTRLEKEILAQLEMEFQAKMNAELAKIRKNSLDAINSLAKLKESIYRQNEKEIMELVISIAGKVISDEIKSSPQVIISMLRKGFEKIKHARQFEIKFHPLDFDLLAREKGGLDEIIKMSGALHFTKDEHVERGGCRIISENGEVSTEPGKQMEIIIKELFDET
ncbi:MAG: FliH/SctL family protein [Acidobacteria bacterium]|jgi:flagellar assembly protein FliH|nr:FliH/SctL family protein [Acidobacteriota bacterium]